MAWPVRSAEIAKLRRLIFGIKAEGFIPAAAVTAAELQLAPDLHAETVAQCKLTSAIMVEYVRAKVEIVPAKSSVHPGHIRLREHLRREVILQKPKAEFSVVHRRREASQRYWIMSRLIFTRNNTTG